MRKESIKKRALKHIKRGLHHLNISCSVDIKNISSEVRMSIKNKKYFSEKDLDELLRKKVRKGVSSKWKGSIKWHKECNRLLQQLKMNINKTIVLDEDYMFYTDSKKSSISTAVEKIQDKLTRFVANNTLTEDDIEKIFSEVVGDNTIRIEVIEYIKLPATIIKPGEITFKVKVTEKSTEKYEIIQASIIIKMLNPM